MENFRKERIESDYYYSLLELKRIGFISLFIVVVTFAFADEDVNQNTIFACTSALQTIILFIAHLALVWRGNNHYNTKILFLLILGFLFEFLIFGIPKDLIYAYRQGILPFPWQVSAKGLGVGGLLSLIFPYLYLAIKLVLVYRLGTIYVFARRINKYLRSPSEEWLNVREIR